MDSEEELGAWLRGDSVIKIGSVDAAGNYEDGGNVFLLTDANIAGLDDILRLYRNDSDNFGVVFS